MDSTVDYQLNYPIKLGNEEILTLKFNRPKIKHLKKLNNLKEVNIDTIAKFIESLTNLPSSTIDQIDTEDLNGISEIINSFFPNSQKEPNSGIVAES